MTKYSNLFIFFLLFFLCWTTTVIAAENDIDTSSEKNAENTIDVGNIDPDVLSKLSEDEKNWYIKFQKGLLFFDGWQEISIEILSVVPDEKIADIQDLLKTLGVKIGTEWCKDNSIRKFDTDQLRSWGKRLRKTKDENPATIFDTLSFIENEVDALMVE